MRDSVEREDKTWEAVKNQARYEDNIVVMMGPVTGAVTDFLENRVNCMTQVSGFFTILMMVVRKNIHSSFVLDCSRDSWKDNWDILLYFMRVVFIDSFVFPTTLEVTVRVKIDVLLPNVDVSKDVWNSLKHIIISRVVDKIDVDVFPIVVNVLVMSCMDITGSMYEITITVDVRI